MQVLLTATIMIKVASMTVMTVTTEVRPARECNDDASGGSGGGHGVGDGGCAAVGGRGWL